MQDRHDSEQLSHKIQLVNNINLVVHTNTGIFQTVVWLLVTRDSRPLQGCDLYPHVTAKSASSKMLLKERNYCGFPQFSCTHMPTINRLLETVHLGLRLQKTVPVLGAYNCSHVWIKGQTVKKNAVLKIAVLV